MANKKGKFKFSMADWKIASAVGIGVGLLILFINFRFFSSNAQIFIFMNLAAAVVALSMPVYVKYREHSRMISIEKIFPSFLRDLTENINVGMTLPQSIRALSSNDYGILSPYVKEMSAKIDWGISFEKALENFAKKTRSKVIRRTVRGIVEAHRSGGKLSSIMEAISVSVQELEKIRKERAARVYSQMVTGYFIFFIFVGIMWAMSKMLIPTFFFERFQGVENVSVVFQELFRNLVVVQGVFSGIAIGKMAEGTITAGFKHSFVLAVVGYTVLAI